MDKELKNAIDDYIRSYKAYIRKDNPESYDFTLMQSAAINVIKNSGIGYHITYSELFEWCKKNKVERSE